MRLHSTAMNGSASVNGTTENEQLLQHTFSDINVNLTTSEVRCTNFMRHYSNLSAEQKGTLLCMLAQAYGIDKNNVLNVSRFFTTLQNKDDSALLTAADRMRIALRPKHKTLFTHIGRVAGGVKFLVDLRSEVLTMKQNSTSELNSALFQELNSTLRELLLLWFTVGFLNLERITWSSPCDLVQKVSNYEAVHRIRTWSDIKQRVGPYRRCYIFTHNAMPREPVVVLHTALTKEISSNIQSIIQNSRFRPSLSRLCGDDSYQPDSTSAPDSTLPFAPPTINTPPVSPPVQTTASSIFATKASAPMDEEQEDPSQIQCAVFYSITSTQKGLQGIDMGNYLIKTVVKKLQEEFPHLSQFSSLSPIPGFRDWLLAQVKHRISLRSIGEDPGVPLLLPQELSLMEMHRKEGQSSALETFRDLLTSHEWVRTIDLQQAMVGPLMRLCANYLYVQKRRGYALNPVANFHLSNGAMLWRVNFLADLSHRGLLQSCSLMVNYRYFLESTDTNSRNYLEGHQIAVSPSVLNLLQSPVIQNS